MCIIGLDIHRAFAEAVAWEDGRLRRRKHSYSGRRVAGGLDHGNIADRRHPSTRSA
ncbi:hypothetical protein [Mesorhizobium sp. M0040]|uniref:hypothetical protein n=1 Tax=Mesorhizobium sp. M0040 TaxID=2956855 RepID=UPI0033388B7C